MRRPVPPRLARSVLLCFVAGLFALCHGQEVPTLRTRTNLVLVPTLVESKTGEPVFNLTAKDFVVADNRVEQKIHLDPETYDQPISIVVLVQVGRSAVREFRSIRVCRPWWRHWRDIISIALRWWNLIVDRGCCRILRATRMRWNMLSTRFSPETMERRSRRGMVRGRHVAR